MNLIPDVIARRLTGNRVHWPRIVRFSALLNRIGLYFLSQSRVSLRLIYPDGRYGADHDFIVSQHALQGRINEILGQYRRDEGAYKYFFGQPYQGLGIAGVFGDRLTDYRFEDYELRNFIKTSDRVLDIGCNCGFMGLVASYRTGCASTGVDINPYMIKIGQLAAEHLRISDLVELKVGRLQDYRPGPVFDVVLSFATHWTDDANYRVSIDNHMSRMASYLKPGGVMIFETHCNDVGNDEFYAAMEDAKRMFAFNGRRKMTDSDTRELYVMHRR